MVYRLSGVTIKALPSTYAEGPLAPITLRIGITGHRPHKLPAEDLTSLSARIKTILEDLSTETRQLCREPDAAPVPSSPRPPGAHAL